MSYMFHRQVICHAGLEIFVKSRPASAWDSMGPRYHFLNIGLSYKR